MISILFNFILPFKTKINLAQNNNTSLSVLNMLSKDKSSYIQHLVYLNIKSRNK